MTVCLYAQFATNRPRGRVQPALYVPGNMWFIFEALYMPPFVRMKKMIRRLSIPPLISFIAGFILCYLMINSLSIVDTSGSMNMSNSDSSNNSNETTSAASSKGLENEHRKICLIELQSYLYDHFPHHAITSFLKMLISAQSMDTINQLLIDASRTRKLPVSNEKHAQDIVKSFSTCSTNKPSTRVGICMIANGKAPNIQEWIVHHLLMGFEKIHLCDLTSQNNDTDYLYNATEPFVSAGYVEVSKSELPDGGDFNLIQVDCMHECFTKHFQGFDFVAAFDSDEFFLMHNHSCVNSYMERFMSNNSVYIPWNVMVPNAIHDHSQSFLSQYKYQVSRRTGYLYPWKSIRKVSTYKRFKDIHDLGIWPGMDYKYRTVSTWGIPKQSDTFFEVELRHFWGPDWLQMINEKICGLDSERLSHMRARFATVLDFMVEKPEIAKEMPHGRLLNDILFKN